MSSLGYEFQMTLKLSFSPSAITHLYREVVDARRLWAAVSATATTTATLVMSGQDCFLLLDGRWELGTYGWGRDDHPHLTGKRQLIITQIFWFLERRSPVEVVVTPTKCTERVIRRTQSLWTLRFVISNIWPFPPATFHSAYNMSSSQTTRYDELSIGESFVYSSIERITNIALKKQPSCKMLKVLIILKSVEMQRLWTWRRFRKRKNLLEQESEVAVGMFETIQKS